MGEQVARRVWYGAARLRAEQRGAEPAARATIRSSTGAVVSGARPRPGAVSRVLDRGGRDPGCPRWSRSTISIIACTRSFPRSPPWVSSSGASTTSATRAATALTLLVESETGRDDLLTFYGDTGLEQGSRGGAADASGVHSCGRRSAKASVPACGALRAEQRLSVLPGAVLAAQEPPASDPGVVPSQAGCADSRRRWCWADRTRGRCGVVRSRPRCEPRDGSGWTPRCAISDSFPMNDMSALYAEAAGLVMPTFFGPTNIPVLEAFALGCPVVTSDIRGIREQTDGAAILVDPRSPEAIADGLRRLLSSSELARRADPAWARSAVPIYCGGLSAGADGRARSDERESLDCASVRLCAYASSSRVNIAHGVHHVGEIRVAEAGGRWQVQAPPPEV